MFKFFVLLHPQNWKQELADIRQEEKPKLTKRNHTIPFLTFILASYHSSKPRNLSIMMPFQVAGLIGFVMVIVYMHVYAQ